MSDTANTKLADDLAAAGTTNDPERWASLLLGDQADLVTMHAPIENTWRNHGCATAPLTRHRDGAVLDVSDESTDEEDIEDFIGGPYAVVILGLADGQPERHVEGTYVQVANWLRTWAAQ